PSPGGISGNSGDLTNFAPIGQSNVVLLGDLPVNAQVDTVQEFVVNVSTVPGAYPLRVSLVYTDPKGVRMVDDQVIMLLVYSLPKLEISLYRDPGMIYSGMITMLPIQVTNLSKSMVVLGNMTLTTDTGEIMNGTSLVGTLDPGGYYTFDVTYTPWQEGTATLNVDINYTDDFNQLRVYQSKLEVEVLPPMEIPAELIPGEGEVLPEEPVQETGFLAKVWNAIKGFLGIGTGSETPTGGPVEGGVEGGKESEPPMEIEPIPVK
ncbi:MAG: hypothetical protein WA110_08300, partial [Anaerolineaceae bacterium]